jgi:hypothetical protein
MRAIPFTLLSKPLNETPTETFEKERLYMATEADLAKMEAIKRFRSAVRLELTIAGDYVIGRHLDGIKSMCDKQIAAGGVPALESGMSSKAKQIADGLSAAFESQLGKLLGELPPGDTSDTAA